jgi:hypothetical protein
MTDYARLNDNTSKELYNHGLSKLQDTEDDYIDHVHAYNAMI